jgi:hypothetical protein
MTLGTLYSSDRLCPFTHRVLIAARELGVHIDLCYGSEIPVAVRRANESGTWPVFLSIEGGDLIDDSARIVEHLVDRSEERGEDYRCEPATLAVLDRLVGSISKVIRAGKPALQKELRPKLDRALAETAALLEASGGAYLGGERFGQAEGHVAPFLYRLPFVLEIRGHVPSILVENEALAAWVDRTVNRYSFREIAPSRHLIREFYSEKATHGKPLKIGRLRHEGFRGMWADLASRVALLVSDPREDNRELREARDLAYLLFRAMALHGSFEIRIVYPALDAARGDLAFTSAGREGHEREAGEMSALLDLFDRALEAGAAERRDHLAELAASCQRLRAAQLERLDRVEATYLPVLSELEEEQHLSMLRQAHDMALVERPFLIGILCAHMPTEDVLSLLESHLRVVDPGSQEWRELIRDVHAHLSPAQWFCVSRCFEDVLPNSLLAVPVEERRMTLGDSARALQAAAPVERIAIEER